ncbi:hypothetical protein [Streptomyces sp. NPDC017529]|uniref:hypothetical protein n=1 Tax=Streptomyces sp. NPDC017529 TaxID=3365000 RepID=UPI0037BC6FCB
MNRNSTARVPTSIGADRRQFVGAGRWPARSRSRARADVPHALVDTDQLDQVHPWPPPGLGASELSRRNLAALWANFAGVGHTRLILTGVFVAPARESEWIAEAVPGAGITAVQLTADVATLEHRVRRREIGTGCAGEHRAALRPRCRPTPSRRPSARRASHSVAIP